MFKKVVEVSIQGRVIHRCLSELGSGNVLGPFCAIAGHAAFIACFALFLSRGLCRWILRYIAGP